MDGPLSIDTPVQYVPRHAFGYGNYIATVDPTATDDKDLGYTVGSWWYKAVSPYGLWHCVDNTSAAAVWVELPLADRGMRSLFDHFTAKSTTGTSQQTLYIDQIDLGTLKVNGDKVVAEYAGTAMNAGNSKTLSFYFAGSSLGTMGFTTEDPWKVFLTIIRVNNTTIEGSISFDVKGNDSFVELPTVTGLDLDATDYDLELRATTPTSAGDVTVKIAHGIYIPAAVTNTGWVTYLGEGVTYGGEEVTYTE